MVQSAIGQGGENGATGSVLRETFGFDGLTNAMFMPIRHKPYVSSPSVYRLRLQPHERRQERSVLVVIGNLG